MGNEFINQPPLGTSTHLPAHHIRLLKMASYGSFGLAICLIALKAWAWVVSDAISMQASLVDSLVDAFSSFINLIAITHAIKPADEEHRFGHGKIEAVAAQGQSLFVGGTAIWIIFEAFHRFLHPQPLENLNLGLIVSVFTIIASLALVLFQNHVIKVTRSPAIRADSLHYKSDLLLNLSVIGGLVGVSYFQIQWMDAACGLLIGFYIAYTSWSMAREAFDILIDREIPDHDREAIVKIIHQHPEVKGFHDLKTRSSGQHHFIQLHLELDGHMTLFEAHRISLQVADEIRQQFPKTEVLIHEDPFDGHDDSHP